MKITTIVTVFNKAPYIAETLEGIVSQVRDSFTHEILVVDDASTDGSQEILKDFAARYPQLIRTLLHEQNRGITKTWLEACALADGEYIARCDGDDLWADPRKLEKQLALLLRKPACGFCNTDFSVINEQGDVLCGAALKTGYIPRIRSFEEMLVSRGMTNASTWLCRKELMTAACRGISPEAVDDTFELQLELFMRSELLTLEEPACAYRLLNASDSHSVDMDRVRERNARLLESQKRYLALNSHADKEKILELLLEDSNAYNNLLPLYHLKERECEQLQERTACVPHSRPRLTLLFPFRKARTHGK